MKRIQSACLHQTFHFLLKEDLPRKEAEAMVHQEVAGYKAGLKRRNIKFQVEEERTLPDGSVLLKLRKQYNSYPCAGYLQ